MTPLIEFFVKQMMSFFMDSVFLIWGFHLWNKIKYPFSFKKCIAVFLIFIAAGNLFGVQVWVVQGTAKYILYPNGIKPQSIFDQKS